MPPQLYTELSDYHVAGTLIPCLFPVRLDTICFIVSTNIVHWRMFTEVYHLISATKMRHLCGPRQANLVLIAYASSEGSGEPAHPRSLARTFAARSYRQWIKRNLQTESQIPGPSEWLGMRSWNLSWRNARRQKFAWRGPVWLIGKYLIFK